MDRIMKIINEYSQKEFGEPADFSDMECVPLAYTTTENEKHEIRVYADLFHWRMIYFIDNNVYGIDQYKTLDEMYYAIDGITFDSLIAFYGQTE